jgi:hypothetical protein
LKPDFGNKDEQSNYRKVINYIARIDHTAANRFVMLVDTEVDDECIERLQAG